MLKLEERVNYMGWPNCLRLYNATVELIVATDIGIRILHFGFTGGKNIFYLSPEDKGKQGGDQWRIYGGHRLWHAPEAIPRTYHPDNFPVRYSFADDRLMLTQPVESGTGILKEMEIRLFSNENRVQIVHRITNQNQQPVKLSAWAISAMRPGGYAVIPQEPYGEGDDYLLPARPLALWSYTRMNDPRWIWGDRFILAKQDPAFASEQKIGMLNKTGWLAYCMEDEFLIKSFSTNADGCYPDFGSNAEIYINGKFLELETLGEYNDILPGASSEHTEYWELIKCKITDAELSISNELIPAVQALKSRFR